MQRICAGEAMLLGQCHFFKYTHIKTIVYLLAGHGLNALYSTNPPSMIACISCGAYFGISTLWWESYFVLKQQIFKWFVTEFKQASCMKENSHAIYIHARQDIYEHKHTHCIQLYTWFTVWAKSTKQRQTIQSVMCNVEATQRSCGVHIRQAVWVGGQNGLRRLGDEGRLGELLFNSGRQSSLCNCMINHM